MNRKHSSSPKIASPARRKILLIGLVAVIASVGGGLLFADWWNGLPEGTQATYVGGKSCMQCHVQQAKKWEGSDHDRAMDHATETSVLGDFNDATFEHHGIQCKMFRRDGKFMIYTEGPDGKMADFEIKYVFGFSPLQQYMVEFDRPKDMPKDEVARLQVLRVSWDTKKKEWFYLAPPDVKDKLEPDDDLHWTGIAQRWNNMCADCHSTNLKKNFDVKTKTYHTTFSEINVSCEACHGPGSTHVELANAKSLFWDRKLGYGLPKLKGKTAQETEIQACAPCHARRRIIAPEFHPGQNYFDFFATETLGEMTYHADGQILDEVYEHGSFLQSKMYHKGIRCSDCHDPHSTKIKFQGNQLCTSCHAHQPGKYDSPTHHRHAPGTKGAQCVECHMPTTTYMEVDPRRDHSIRVPRPALSVKFNTPNACTGCHVQTKDVKPGQDVPKVDEALAARKELREYADWLRAARLGDEAIKGELAKFDRWAADKTKAWYPEKKDEPEHYAATLYAARTRQPDADERLMKLARDKRYPALVRATAMINLGGSESKESLAAAERALADPDPQLRAAALTRLESALSMALTQPAVSEQEHLSRLKPIVAELEPLLDDPVRLVRTEASRVLARLPQNTLNSLVTGKKRRRMSEVLQEYKDGLMLNNDRAGAHMVLALLYEDQGEMDSAVRSYRTAMQIEKHATGPRTNLAALLDRMGHQTEDRIRQMAAQGQTQQIEQMATMIGNFREEAEKLRKEEFPLLARDARLAPDNAAIQYRYAMSLYVHQQEPEAEKALLKAVQLAPDTPDAVMALALLFQKQKRFDEALTYAERLIKLRPQDETYQRLLEDLRRQRTQASKPASN